MRLVSHIRYRVSNGEISERSLARLTGISQPHINNVLKGKRVLSAQMADQIMACLHIDLTDLLKSGAEDPKMLGPNCIECRGVTLLDGWIGPNHRFPRTAGRQQYPFPASDVDRLEKPLAARLAPDPLRTATLGGRGVVLLDCSEQARLSPDRGSYFALDLAGGGTIGLIRRAGRHLNLLSLDDNTWHCTQLPDGDPLEIIKGRVVTLIFQL
jgi:transcriptional regulator with XRE-family HTH domain